MLHKDTGVVGVHFGSVSKSDSVIVVSALNNVTVYSLADGLCLRQWAVDETVSKKQRTIISHPAVIISGTNEIVAYSKSQNSLLRWDYFNESNIVPATGEKLKHELFTVLTGKRLNGNIAIVNVDGNISLRDSNSQISIHAMTGKLIQLIHAELVETTRFCHIVLGEIIASPSGGKLLQLRVVEIKQGGDLERFMEYTLDEDIDEVPSLVIHSLRLASIVYPSGECKVAEMNRTTSDVRIQSVVKLGTISEPVLCKAQIELPVFFVADKNGLVSAWNGRFGKRIMEKRFNGLVPIQVVSSSHHLAICTSESVVVESLRAEWGDSQKPSLLAGIILVDGQQQPKSHLSCPDMSDLVSGNFDPAKWKRKLDVLENEADQMLSKSKQRVDLDLKDKSSQFVYRVLEEMVQHQNWKGAAACLPYGTSSTEVLDSLIAHDQIELLYSYVKHCNDLNEFEMIRITKYIINQAPKKELVAFAAKAELMSKADPVAEQFVTQCTKDLGKEGLVVFLFLLAVMTKDKNEVFLVQAAKKFRSNEITLVASSLMYILCFLDKITGEKSKDGLLIPNFDAALGWACIVVDSSYPHLISQTIESNSFKKFIENFREFLQGSILACDKLRKIKEPLRHILRQNRTTPLNPFSDYKFETIRF